MAKNNIRSFRYSDDVEKILESFSGNSLNEKFENLVTYCYQSIPKVERQKKYLENEIKSLEKKRNELYDTTRQLAVEVSKMKCIKDELYTIDNQCCDIVKRLDKICNTIPGAAAVHPDS